MKVHVLWSLVMVLCNELISYGSCNVLVMKWNTFSYVVMILVVTFDYGPLCHEITCLNTFSDVVMKWNKYWFCCNT